MDRDEARSKVIDFIQRKGYIDSIVVLGVCPRGKYVDVMTLEPYGLFIVSPEGVVEDNYQVFADSVLMP